ncbi:acetylornithine deacetylase [Alphaproteobacteria bacterium GH1-50]|uniref:Acetylornithine deacetylase n=1 Tax=Kangsaoukella pontilimi TaxID=2691042 RepID=A0A7C9II24_9RHOB|nr:acetylornithine deacetylase [Kangsaoukella pontilimi]MXQ09069.1 acetylornithine deacetylase [Kangsaoukella pontilimi]
MSTLDLTIAHLDRLVSFPTVSSDSNLELIHWIAEQLSNLDAQVEIMVSPEGDKANLFASFGPDEAGGIVLSGHTDVVPVEDQPWSTEPFALTRQDDRLLGRGTCDMKGFIACCLAVAPAIAAADLRRPIHFAFTYDEETGCLGGRELVAALSARDKRPALAIVGEPTEMRIIEGHKGCHEYTTVFHGLEGHGSDPDAGVSAVEYAVRYVSRLLEVKAELAANPVPGSRFSPPWTTINVGSLSGGVAHNVIAPLAEVSWDLRPVRDADQAWVKTTMEDFAQNTLLPEMQSVHPEAAIETHTIGEVQGLEPMDDNEARDLVMGLTGGNTTDVVSFGTEAGLFQSLGMSVVVCGPGSIVQAHKADEYIEVSELEACLAMLERLIERASS